MFAGHFIDHHFDGDASDVSNDENLVLLLGVQAWRTYIYTIPICGTVWDSWDELDTEVTSNVQQLYAYTQG